MLCKMLSEKGKRPDDVILYCFFADADQLTDLIMAKTLFPAQAESALLLGRQLCDTLLDRGLQLGGG